MNIILCGLPKSGKTTLGYALARALTWKFVDTDWCVETRYEKLWGKHMSCREIVREKGEAYFRDLERKQISQLRHQRRSVIATGGGSFEDPRNVAVLSSIGRILYLKVPLSLLCQRYHGHSPPSFYVDGDIEASLHQLMNRRAPVFESVADDILVVNNWYGK